MELLKSFGWVMLGIGCLVGICLGMEGITHLPKPWGMVTMLTLLLVLCTLLVHSMRMSRKEWDQKRKDQGW